MCFSSRQLFIHAAVVIAMLLLAPSLPAQKLRTPQVEGNYVGVTLLGVKWPKPTEIGLEIVIQDDRRFLGSINYLELDTLLVAGSISKSGQCQIIAESNDAKATVHLDWQLRGGGAATLLGDLALTSGGKSQTGPVAWLRPYDELAIDWSRLVDRYPATFTSAASGGRTSASFELTAGIQGVLQARILDWADPDPTPILPDPPGWTCPDPSPIVVGTTSVRGDLLAVGVGSGPNQIVTLTGRVTTDDDGLPLAIDGTYLIEHTAGKVIDVGSFRVLLAP
jgi:hypothetical protein